MMEKPGAEHVFLTVREMNQSSQVTLEAFQQQLEFVSNFQQKTLEDVSVVRTEIADTLNKSIGEIEHFQSPLFTAVITSTLKGENSNNGIINTEYKRNHTGIFEEVDYVAKRNLLYEAAELSLMGTSDDLGTLDSTELSSDNDQDSDTQQNYTLQYNNKDSRKLEESNVSFKSRGVNLLDFRKQDSYIKHTNLTEEVDYQCLGVSNRTFNVNKSDAGCKKSEPTLDETVHNKYTSKKKDSGKTFKNMEEEGGESKPVNTELVYKMQELKGFLSKVDQVKIHNQSESRPLKVLKQQHINARSFLSKNLQINRLRTDKTFLHILLSRAEQDAEVCRQEVKAMTDKCEELLKHRKQIEDERNHLRFEKHLLMKEIKLLKEENHRLLNNLPAASTEKEELRNLLDSSKQMALSYATEKHKIQCKRKEALMEIYRLRRIADESRTQDLKKKQDNLLSEKKPWSMENI